MSKVPRRLLALGVGIGAFAAAATTALAAAPTGAYAPFAQCPTTVPSLSSCVYSTSSSGTITLGREAVPVTAPIVFQGGYVADPNTGDETFYGAVNGQTLISPPLPVPGGLLGLTTPNTLPQPLRGILQKAINSLNGVTATATLVGAPQFSFTNFANVDGPSVTLPLEIQLSNPFLGKACYIGSAAKPVTFNLTDGTTSPPTGVTPLTGNPGTLTFMKNGNLILATGDSLVDNTFSVPVASGCGGAFAALIDPIVDLKVGLPSAAGVSSAVLNGNAQIAAASAVIKSEKKK